MRLDYLNHQSFDANGVRLPHLVSYPGVGITLSRRNVISFLAKLDGHPPLSHAQIAIDTDAGPLSITARAHTKPTLALTDLPDGLTAIKLTLSRDNLTSLLVRLARSDQPPIPTFDSAAGPISIGVEEDAIHYAARAAAPGPMHPATESALLDAIPEPVEL